MSSPVSDDKNWIQSAEADERPHFHFPLDNELLCKNQCGFYGTPQCKGLCSQCWRNYQLENKRLSDYNRNRELLRQETVELLRKTSDVRHTFRTLLKKSPSVFTQDMSQLTLTTSTSNSTGVNSPVNTRPPSPESTTVLADLQKYLNQNFTGTTAAELEKHCRKFVENLLKEEFMPIDELSASVQSFYQSMRDKVLKLKDPLPEQFKLSQFMTELETFVCVRAYHLLFGSRTEEEAEDLSLQTRIRSLNWVTNGFLETALDESSNQVQEYINEAITEIIDINSRRSVIGKMDCLVRCSKNIFDALKESRFGAPASADEFLPVLILIVLKANPPLIQSNLKFISRFGLPSRHMRGEYGYYYTNLSSAIYFIQDMKASSLQLTEEEFEDYTSGKRIPSSVRNSMSIHVMRSIENSLKRLDGLIQTQNELSNKLDELDAKITKDCAEFRRQLKEFVEEDHPEMVKKIIEDFNKQSSSEANNDQDT